MGKTNRPESGLAAALSNNRPPPRRAGFIARLRTYFLAGVLVTAPVTITAALAWWVIESVDTRVVPLIPAKYNPETYLPFSVPGIGLLLIIGVVTVIGMFTANFLGRWMVRSTEGMVLRMPVIRTVYGAVKQIFETVVREHSDAFRQVVLFEYPRRGCWAMGFITGLTEGEIQALTEDEVVNVFLPTTPNPTSGYLLFVPKRELVVLDMTVEEGIKMIVSGGIITPPDRRPESVKEIKRVAAADGDAQTLPYEKPTELDEVS